MSSLFRLALRNEACVPHKITLHVDLFDHLPKRLNNLARGNYGYNKSFVGDKIFLIDYVCNLCHRDSIPFTKKLCKVIRFHGGGVYLVVGEYISVT